MDKIIMIEMLFNELFAFSVSKFVFCDYDKRE
jgi:hypothetical protein